MTPAWTQLRHHEVQSQVWYDPIRFKNVYAGRGSGKTELARRYIVRWLSNRKPWSDPKYVYAMPTYRQAKKIAWHALLNLIPKNWLMGAPNISEMRIDTVFGSTLFVVGLDQPARIEGDQYDGVVVDERSDIKPGAIKRALMPAMAHRNAWLWQIGVPKRYGVGAEEFKEFCDLGDSNSVFPGTNDRIKTYNWPSADILTDEQLAFFKATLDQKDFDEQFRAHWLKAGGAIFHAFHEDDHVSDTVHYRNDLPICVGSDYNVDPMSWCLGHVIEESTSAGVVKKIHIFDEVFLRDVNTAATLEHLYSKYAHHSAGWEFYGDASSKARKTSAEFTDYAQICNDDRFVGKEMYYLDSNPSIVDRFTACNAMLKNANGEVRVQINPRCKQLIKDLKARTWKQGYREPDDGVGDIGHMTDAFGYFLYYRFPVKIEIVTPDSQPVAMAAYAPQIAL